MLIDTERIALLRGIDDAKRKVLNLKVGMILLLVADVGLGLLAPVHTGWVLGVTLLLGIVASLSFTVVAGFSLMNPAGALAQVREAQRKHEDYLNREVNAEERRLNPTEPDITAKALQGEVALLQSSLGNLSREVGKMQRLYDSSLVDWRKR